MGEEKLTLKDRLFAIEPRHLVVPIILVLAFVGTLIGVINYQTKNKSQVVPKIQISSPAEGSGVESDQIALEGSVSTGASVKINSNSVAVDSKGKFKSDISLKEGENIITVVATNKNGKEAVAKRKVTRTTKQPEQADEAQPVSTEEQTQTQQTGKTDLSSAGPENFWIPEAGFFAAVGAAWFGSRKKLKVTLHR